MQFIWFIIHAFTNCKESDLDWFKNKRGTCKKCGRVHFKWEN